MALFILFRIYTRVGFESSAECHGAVISDIIPRRTENIMMNPKKDRIGGQALFGRKSFGRCMRKS